MDIEVKMIIFLTHMVSYGLYIILHQNDHLVGLVAIVQRGEPGKGKRRYTAWIRELALPPTFS